MSGLSAMYSPKDFGKNAKVEASAGYYIWWAKKEQVERLLKWIFDDTVKFDELESLKMQEENGAKWYAIYTGISRSSLRVRLGEHIKSGENIKSSTLRKTLYAILYKENKSKPKIDDFLNELKFSFEISDKSTVLGWEKNCLINNFFLLNIQGNKVHNLSKQTVSSLKALRKLYK